jgi:hypothetical protein
MKPPSLVGLALVAAGVGSVLLGACGSRAVPSPEGELGTEAAALAGPRPQKLLADGLPPGMARFRGGGPIQDSNPICNNPLLTYYGGPVLQSPTIVAVFWTGTVAAAVQANIGQFYADVTQSTYWSWLHEYDTVGKSPGSNQAILPGTFGGGFVITPLVCAPGGNNCKLSDVQLQAELVRQINLGVLPAPTLDCTGNANTLYMVSFPPNISLGGPQGAGRSCVNNGFCGYHNTGTYGAANTPLIYAALMDVFTGPCSMGCGSNAKALDNATDLASHELVEAATDADVGLIPDTATMIEAPAGWYDGTNNNCGEIADICDDGSPGDPITVSGRTWVVQQVWSNQQNKCASTGPAPAICSGTTVTGCRPCSCGDNGLSCNGTTAVCETTSSNVLFGGCEACTASSGNCGAGTCVQSATPAQDDICSNCVPATTCPAGDDCGSVSDGCGGTIACGTCTLPQTCGGGSAANPNQCGCSPTITSCPAGFDCGTLPDGCGGLIACGTCTPPQTCGGGASANPNQCGSMLCSPKTCAQQGIGCGAAADGCGNVLQCGNCPPPQSCGGGGIAGQCGSGCTPKTCAQQNLQCGPATDGCGNVLQCGTCPPSSVCAGGQCEMCVLTTCAQQGVVCGPISDGCGNTLQCGSCPLGEACNGGQCNVCVPTTCAQQGIACGVIGDGCGAALQCGNCPPGQTCGGGGVAGQCGACTGKTCADFDANCGSIDDGCGSVVDCGVCQPGQSCGGSGVPNQCGCLPLDGCSPGSQCGTQPDGCGGTVACGTCIFPLVCGFDAPPNQCGCSPATTCPAGEECGSSPDGCGGFIACGTCGAPNEICEDHQCVPESSTTTSSVSSSSSSGGGSGGQGGSTTTSSGSGEWIPIYGRACAAAPGEAPGGGSAAWLALGLMGLTGRWARRRKATARSA